MSFMPESCGWYPFHKEVSYTKKKSWDSKTWFRSWLFNPGLKAIPSNASRGWNKARFLAVMIGVFWKRRVSCNVKRHQCRLFTRQLFSVFAYIVCVTSSGSDAWFQVHHLFNTKRLPFGLDFIYLVARSPRAWPRRQALRFCGLRRAHTFVDLADTMDAKMS
jgi:hypothetical protein